MSEATPKSTNSLIHRLQGVVANMSRVPSFRRRFINMAKALYLEAIEAGAIAGTRDVKRRVKADAANFGKIGEESTPDAAGSSNDPLGNRDMV
jgi:hypothetical protein